MYSLKWELEDLSFKYLYPEEYRELVEGINKKREERLKFIDQIMEHDPRYRFLYQIRPGVTSYATLYNGYTDTMEKMLRRLRYDLFYLEHRSWFFDFKILVKTFLHIAFGKKF